MLKLLAVNLYDMEENSRLERLVAFKKAYGRSVELMKQIAARFCPDWDDAMRQTVAISALQFFHGLYPYAHHTEKQEEAMKQAGVLSVQMTVGEFARTGFFCVFLKNQCGRRIILRSVSPNLSIRIRRRCW